MTPFITQSGKKFQTYSEYLAYASEQKTIEGLALVSPHSYDRGEFRESYPESPADYGEREDISRPFDSHD